MPRINQFFAVTHSDRSTSIYLVQSEGGKFCSSDPLLKKIALRGESSVEVGQEQKSGTLLAICYQLICYIPEGGGITSYNRKIEQVNTRWWLSSTSNVVALFEIEEEARHCFDSNDLQDCDVRWLEQTKRVLDLIGPDHPKFVITNWEDLRLVNRVVRSAA